MQGFIPLEKKNIKTDIQRNHTSDFLKQKESMRKYNIAKNVADSSLDTEPEEYSLMGRNRENVLNATNHFLELETHEESDTERNHWSARYVVNCFLVFEQKTSYLN